MARGNRTVCIDGEMMRKAIHRSGHSMNAFSEKLGYSTSTVKQGIREGRMSLPVYNLVIHELMGVGVKHGDFITNEPRGYTERPAWKTSPTKKAVVLNDGEIIVNAEKLNAISREINQFAQSMSDVVNALAETVRRG